MSAAVEEEKPAKRKLPFEDVTVDAEPMTTAVVTKHIMKKPKPSVTFVCRPCYSRGDDRLSPSIEGVWP